MLLGKNFKIWGVSYGVVGDLVMGLPVLNYFEKKYPGSYKYWVIEKKVAFTAPLYLNHPLIDCIRISGNLDSFDSADRDIIDSCDVKCTYENWKHDEPDWYNHRGQIEETARIAGIYDLFDVLTPQEQMPKLNPWWDDGSRCEEDDKTIAIWPFAGRDAVELRSPSVRWWNTLILRIFNMGINVRVFSAPGDPKIPAALMDYSQLDYFDQVKLALQCKMSIGTDSGNMWVMGAYAHPGIALMTNWLPGHNKNLPSLLPINPKGIGIYSETGINDISHDKVLEEIERKMK